mgnify:FL=1
MIFEGKVMQDMIEGTARFSDKEAETIPWKAVRQEGTMAVLSP